LQTIATIPSFSSASISSTTYETLTNGTGTYTTIDVAGATVTYVHSTMGGLAVGNANGPTIGVHELPTQTIGEWGPVTVPYSVRQDGE
jgi:hypothetical protein